MKRSSPSIAESLTRSCWQGGVKRMPLRLPFSIPYHFFLPVLFLLFLPAMVRGNMGDKKTKTGISSGSVDKGNNTPSIIDVRGSLTDRSSSLTNSQKNNSYENVYAVSATISGTATVCLNDVTYITFTGSGGGSLPYKFFYTIDTVGNGGLTQILSTGVSSSVTITVTTNTSRTINYELFLVTDGGNVPGTISGSSIATVTVNPLPSVNPITGPAAVCVGSTISLTSTTSGGVWSSNNAAATINATTGLVTGVSAGSPTMSYGVTSLGCTTTVTTTTTVNPNPVINTISPLNPSICRGQTSFVENFGTSNSPDQYQIIWGATAIAEGFTNVSFAPNNFNPVVGDIIVAVPATAAAPASYAGVLTLKISATGCQFTGITATVNVNSLPTVVVANPAAVCTPATVDLTAASITSAGSTAGLSYTQWTNALATSVLVNANAVTITGNYYIKGTVPATGCAVTQPVSATINASPTVTITNPAAVCTPATVDLTAASITSAGSTAGLSYTQWTNALATSVLVNANAVTITGNYYIKGTVPATGCAVTQPVSATINASPTVTITNPAAVCTPATVDLTAASITSAGSTAGLSYTQWTNALATSVLVNANAVTITGNYYIKGTVQATGCAVTQPVSATINTSPTVVVTNPAAVCSPLTIDLTATGITSAGSTAGLSYTQWTDALAISALANANAVTITGTYYIKGTVPATGCAATQPVSATINALPTVAITNPTSVCSPSTIDLTASSITTGSTGGLTYTRWTDALATSVLVNANAVTATGTYYIKGTVPATGCTVTQPVNATINTSPTVTITNPAAVCSPATVDLTSASITTGSTNGLTFTRWTDAAATNILSNATAIATGGTYYIKGTTAANCSVIQPVVATVNPLPTVTITNPAAVCSPLTIDLTSASITTGSTGGLTYTRWTDASATNILSNATAIATGGTYYIKGTTAANCSVIQPVVATVNPLPTVTITNPAAVCSPATIDLTSASITTGSTNGLTYTRWTDASATNILSNATAIAMGGTYYIKGTTGANCSVIQPVVATVNPLPTVTITNPAAVCSPATIDLTSANITTGSTGGLTYTRWTNAAGTNPLLNASVVAASGTYYIKGTTAANCSVIQPVIATVNPLPTATISATGPTTFCTGGSVNLTASAGRSYLWNTNETSQTINVTATGNKSVTVTDANGCSATSSVTAVTVNALPTATISAGGPITFCAGGSVNLTASAGSSYLWSTNETSQTINATATGNKSVTVTDANGCSTTSSVTAVTVHALPTATISANGLTTFCAGGTVNLTAGGGLSYLWNAGETSQTIQVTSTGNKQVRVTDANGCTANSSITAITVKPLPPATINANGPTTFCEGGSVTLTAAAANNYVWDSGETTQSVTVTNSAVKQVTVTGANGCSATSTAATVTVNPAPNLVVAGISPVCSPSSINLTSPSIIAGSTAGLTITHWRDAAATLPLSNPASVNSSGTYYIKGTTSAGCSVVKAVNLSVHPQPTLVVTDPAPVCSPATISLLDAQITAGSSSGTAFSYWNDAAATQPVTAPSAISVPGTYFIKGSLLTGCTSVQPVTVNIFTPPAININNPAPVCEPSAVNLTTAVTTGGNAADITFKYYTDAAQTNQVAMPASVTSSGTYYIKGISKTGCSASLPVAVVINPLPKGILQNPPVNYICDGLSLLLNAVNADTYQWYADQKLIPGATAASYAATKSGNYTVQFISKEGCTANAANTIRLDLLTKPVLQFKPNSFCAGSPVSFTNSSVVSNSGGITWQWDFGDGSSSNTQSPVHTFQNGGSYAISLTANNASCSNLTEKIIANYTIETTPAAVRYDTIKAVGGKSFIMDARAIGINYLWYPATGLNNPGIRSPRVTINNDMAYTVTIKTAAGCVTNDSVYVKVATEGDIYVADGFTPNGDGLNDRCYPMLVGIRTLTYFKVFNRWGNLVFQTNDATPQNGWDGKLNGKLQTTGTYIWIAEAIDGGGNIVKRTGNILLIN